MARTSKKPVDFDSPEAVLIRNRLNDLVDIHGSQSAVAELIGKHKQSVSDWLNKKKIPDGISTVKIIELSMKSDVQPSDTGAGNDRLFLRIVYPDSPQETMVLCKRVETAFPSRPFVFGNVVASYSDGRVRFVGTRESVSVAQPPDHEIVGEILPLSLPGLSAHE